MHIETERLLRRIVEHNHAPDSLPGILAAQILTTDMFAATGVEFVGTIFNPLNSTENALKALPPGWGGAHDTEGFAWAWHKTTGHRVDAHIPDAPARAVCHVAVQAWAIERGDIAPAGSVRWDVRAFNASFSTACRKHDAKAMFVALTPLVGGKDGQFSVVTGGDALACQLVEAYLRAGGMAV